MQFSKKQEKVWMRIVVGKDSERVTVYERSHIVCVPANYHDLLRLSLLIRKINSVWCTEVDPNIPFYGMLFFCVVSYIQWTKHVLVICVGQEVVCYESPRPTAGIHRFVFVLFRQVGRQAVYAPGWRHNFNTRDFAELYILRSPVAVVYFNCQRDSGSGGRRP
jgi:protein FLOWERING LOCUS T